MGLHILPPVKPCDCGATCDCAHDGNPCWGQVSPVDEVPVDEDGDYAWIHACEGHFDVYDSGDYIQPPNVELTGLRPQGATNDN